MLRFQIIRIIGINMVRSEISGYKLFRGLYMLHVYRRALLSVDCGDNGVFERIGCRPVREGHKPLLLIARSLIFYNRVAKLSQGRLKRRGVVGCSHIFSDIFCLVRIVLIRIGHKARLPLYAKNISYYPF